MATNFYFFIFHILVTVLFDIYLGMNSDLNIKIENAGKITGKLALNGKSKIDELMNIYGQNEVHIYWLRMFLETLRL